MFFSSLEQFQVLSGISLYFLIFIIILFVLIFKQIMFFNSISANLKDFSIRFWEFPHNLLKLLLIFSIFYFYINYQQNITFLEFIQDDSSQEQTPNDSVKNVLFSLGLGVLSCFILFYFFGKSDPGDAPFKSLSCLDLEGQVLPEVANQICAPLVSETIINAVTVVSDQISSPLVSETIVGVASVAATCLPLINMDMLSISEIAEVCPAFIPNTPLFHQTFYSFDLESLLIKGKESLPWLNEEDPALIYNFTILDNFISQYVYNPNTVVKFVANVLYKTFLIYNIDFTSFMSFYQNCLIHLKELSLKADPTSIGIPNILDLNLREVQISLKFKLNEILLGLFFGMFFKLEAFFSVFLEPRYDLIDTYFLHQLIGFDLEKDLTKIVKFKGGQMTIKCGQILVSDVVIFYPVRYNPFNKKL